MTPPPEGLDDNRFEKLVTVSEREGSSFVILSVERRISNYGFCDETALLSDGFGWTCPG